MSLAFNSRSWTRLVMASAAIMEMDGHNVTLDGEVMANGGDFGNAGGAIFACAQGETCNDAIPLTSADWHWWTSPRIRTGTPLRLRPMACTTSVHAATNATRVCTSTTTAKWGALITPTKGPFTLTTTKADVAKAQLTVLLEGGVTVLDPLSCPRPCTDAWAWEFGFAGPPGMYGPGSVQLQSDG